MKVTNSVNIQQSQIDQLRLVTMALQAHRLGLCVVPGDPGSKSPCVSGFTSWNRRPGPRIIRRWWSRWPDANVLIQLGPFSRGFIMRDFDTTEDYETWTESKPELANWLPTVRTKNGYHVYFREYTGYVQSHDLRDLDPPVLGELKGQGTLAVFPGSTVDGHLYDWVNHWKPDEDYTVELAPSGLVPEHFEVSQKIPSPPITEPMIQSAEKRERIKARNRRNSVECQALNADPGNTPSGHQGFRASGHQGSPPKLAFSRSEIFALVDQFPIAGQRQRREALKGLVFGILELTGQAKPGEKLQQAFHGAWWQRFGHHCRTDKEESLLDFCSMIEEIRGDHFLIDVARTLETIELPPWAVGRGFGPKSLEVVRLVVACDQHCRSDGTFFISRPQASKITGLPDGMIRGAFELLRRRGILELVKAGTHPSEKLPPKKQRANQYRLIAPSSPPVGTTAPS